MVQPIHSMQLTLVRVREFVREPEAVFWAVLFPILLAVGLGLAFRGRPEPVLKIAAHRRTSPPRCSRSPASTSPSCRTRRRGSRCETATSRCGRPGRRRAASFPVTTTRIPKAHRADARGSRASARRRPRRSGADHRRADARARRALHRLSGAGPDRHRHHEQRRLGSRLLDRRHPPPQADQAPDGDADVARAVSAARTRSGG